MKVIYFSHTGNCKKMAEAIANRLGVEAERIVPENDYPADCSERAKHEIEVGLMPAINWIKTDDSGVIVVFPSWHRRLPPPVVSFFRQRNLNNAIAIVSSYEGDAGACEFVLRELCNSPKIIAMKQGDEDSVVEKLEKRGLLK